MSEGDCPCGAQRVDRRGKKQPISYEGCCGQYHQINPGPCSTVAPGTVAPGKAPTCEALMRSRYCAFVKGDASYLLSTWHPRTRPGSVKIDPDQRWLGLKIVGTSDGLEDDEEGTVTFVARYKIAGKAYRLKETSRFLRINGRWHYLTAD